jgi:hypothetical protein
VSNSPSSNHQTILYLIRLKVPLDIGCRIPEAMAK